MVGKVSFSAAALLENYRTAMEEVARLKPNTSKGRYVRKITEPCPGCMYGSYPEMTIAMRFLKAKFERMKLFLASPPAKRWPVSYEQMVAAAERIRSEPRDRVTLPDHHHHRHRHRHRSTFTVEICK